MYKTHQLRTTFGSWDVEKVQRAQTKIAKDDDPSGRASKLCLNRAKHLSKYVKNRKPCKTIGDSLTWWRTWRKKWISTVAHIYWFHRGFKFYGQYLYPLHYGFLEWNIVYSHENPTKSSPSLPQSFFRTPGTLRPRSALQPLSVWPGPGGALRLQQRIQEKYMEKMGKHCEIAGK